jgi:hypothetical protein
MTTRPRTKTPMPPVEPEASAELALLVDVGSAWTKASLVGRTRGRWHLVTHVAQPSAWGGAALDAALVERLAPTVDRRLEGRLAATVGSAARIECHTPARSARLAISAVSRELSGAAARRAAEAAGWEVAVLAAADDGRPLAERLAALQSVEVDAWLVTGGFDDGRSMQALEAAALVAAARPPGAPVIWAGSSRLADEVGRLIEPEALVRLPNPRPDAHHERGDPLRAHLEERLLTTVEPGADAHLAPVALRRAVAQLARVTGLRVAAVDVGARYASRVEATTDGEAVSRVHAAGGLTALAPLPAAAARIGRALGHGIDELAVADALQNLRARPGTLPHSPDELAVTQAAARTQLAVLAEESPLGAVDLVVGAGRAIAGAPQPGAATGMLLDGLRPVGVTQLAIDAAALLGPLGALPDSEIADGLTLLGDDLLVPLGTAVVCRGGEPGRVAMRVTIRRAGWPDVGPVDVRTGQLQLVPLGRGQRAELVIDPTDGVSLGAPRRAGRVEAEVTGGVSGIVLDARGVPLTLPRRADDRRSVVAGWRESLLREPLPGAEQIR